MNSGKVQALSISPAELEILKILWDDSPLDADSIILRLDTNQSTHPRTVKTLLNRLVKKKAIDFKEEGRKYHYFSILDRDTYFKHETQSFLNRCFDGQISPLLTYFAKQNKLSDKDIAELEQLIEHMKVQGDE